jgi:hypothetical protein
MPNELMTEAIFKKAYSDLSSSIAFIEELKERVPDNRSMPSEFTKYRMTSYLKDLREQQDLLVKQYTCDHKNTTGMEYCGHDSHHDHYSDKCKDCGLELDSENR